VSGFNFQRVPPRLALCIQKRRAKQVIQGVAKLCSARPAFAFNSLQNIIIKRDRRPDAHDDLSLASQASLIDGSNRKIGTDRPSQLGPIAIREIYD
jgi:hypothetical protein